MKFGAHISIAGGIEKAPQRAHEIGCECFQIFSKSPHGGKSVEITEKVASDFQAEAKKYDLQNYYIHTPYYINLASANSRIYYGSISSIKEELQKADLLGAKAVVTHLGSAKDLGEKEAKEKLVAGLKKIFLQNDIEKNFNAKLLLEITAGAGEIMGDNFEEIAYFIKEVEKEIKKNKLGVCFDTAHAFASGYDLRNEKAVKNTFDKFDKIIGIERLGLVHLNDSMAKFDSHKDRHDNIGNGKIGIEGFEAILQDERLKSMDFILETPNNKAGEELEILKELKGKI
ncbi:MAG: deoxyribonuclease IV [Candidatus Pacebacteria bacterium]|nr:deoxyribonuclease IV [Candidatus Paceibacterota bacterium]